MKRVDDEADVAGGDDELEARRELSGCAQPLEERLGGREMLDDVEQQHVVEVAQVRPASRPVEIVQDERVELDGRERELSRHR